MNMRGSSVIRRAGFALLAFATALACGHGPPSDAALPIEFTLSEGHSIELSRLSLRVEATKVLDVTSQGCLGGPSGCQDYIELLITRDSSSRSQLITLHVAHTEGQAAEGINQGDAFEYRITLKDMRNAVATLLIDRR